MEVYVVTEEIVTSNEIPSIDCAVFDTSKKAMDYIRAKYQFAIEYGYEKEYKEFLATPDMEERERKGLFEFDLDEENCCFEIYQNGAYNEEHYCMYLHNKEVR